MPVLYAPTTPILVTIDVPVVVIAGGAGGEIILDVITKWGTVDGTNTVFRIASESNNIKRLTTFSALLSMPLVPSAIIIQWTATFMPAGADVMVESDTTEAGSHYIVRRITSLTIGQART